MNKHIIHQRQSRRVKLDLSGESEDKQSQGMAIRLCRPGFFGRLICLGVLKNVSKGGAGLLIPSNSVLEKKFVIKFSGGLKLAVSLRYRRPISTRLEFVGVKWNSANERKISKVMQLVEKNRKVKLANVTDLSLSKEVTYEE